MRRVLNPAVERLTPAELADLQWRRVAAQVRRCVRDVPFYARRWPAGAADVRTLDEFRDVVPFTAKADFLGGSPEADGRLATGSHVFQHHLTSGTTGLGQEVHPVSTADHEALGAGWHYQAHWAGIRPRDTICFTWPIGLQTGGLSTPAVAQRLGVVAVQLGPYSSEDKIAYLERFQPQAVVASPSYLTHLAVLFHRSGRCPADALPGLRALFVAGESYTVPWVEETVADWGCPVSEWYGLMQGGMNQAVACEGGVLVDGRRGALHCLDHRILSEVLDPATGAPVGPGEEGEMVLTTLTRDAFPVVRFRTGDKVRLCPRPCACGRPFTSIEAGTIARYDDMMKVRGQNLWPASVDHVVLGDPRVAEYAGEVALDESGREDVLLRVELREPVDHDAGALDDLRRQVKSVTNVSVRVELAAPGSLPRFEFKARRWVDRRRTGRTHNRYLAR